MLEVKGFYAHNLAQCTPEGQPLVVYRDKAVLDGNVAALSRGVEPGASLRDARAILGGDGMFVAWERGEHEPASEAWLDLCCEFADGVEALDQHRVAADLGGHPRPEQLVPAMVDRVQRGTGLEVGVGLGSSKLTARLAMRFGDPLGLATDEPHAFLAALPVTALPLEPRVAELLVRLGCRLVGDLPRMSSKTLRTQFGSEGLRLSRLAHGMDDDPVRANFPRASLSASLSLESPLELRQEVAEAARTLAIQLGTQLAERELEGHEADLTLAYEGWRAETRHRMSPKPIHSPGSLAVALSAMLETPPAEPVCGMRVRVRNLSKLHRRQTSMQVDKRPDEALAALRRVQASKGVHAVQLGSQVHEPRRARVHRAWSEAYGWLWR